MGYQGLGLILFIILARVLGPEVFGLMALALIITSVSEIFLTDGILEALIQRRDLRSGYINVVFWLLIGGDSMFSLSKLGLTLQYQAVLPVLVATTVMAVAVLLWRNGMGDVLSLISRLVSCIAVVMFAYGFVMMVVSPNSLRLFTEIGMMVLRDRRVRAVQS